MIIHESLLSTRSRSSRLLELTGVSRLWQDFLLVTPLLWSELLIDETQSDAMAILASTGHLSGQTCLRLIFYDHLVENWSDLKAILLPLLYRITILTIVQVEPTTAQSETTLLCAFSGVVSQLGPFPSLKELKFESNSFLELTPIRLESFNLLSGIEAMDDVIIDFPIDFPKSFSRNQTFEDYGLSEQLVLPGAITCLDTRIDRSTNDENIALSSQGTTLLSLRDAMDCLGACRGLNEVMYRTQPNLQRISISIHVHEVRLLFRALGKLEHLRILNLSLLPTSSQRGFNRTSLDLQILSLQEFSISFPQDVDASNNTLGHFFTDMFTRIKPVFPAVGVFRFKSPKNRLSIPPVLYYVESLERLTTLSIMSDNESGSLPPSRVRLSYLQVLSLEGTYWLKFLDTPSLLVLNISDITSGRQIADLILPASLRKLSLGSNMLQTENYALNNAHTLQITELDLRSYGALK